MPIVEADLDYAMSGGPANTDVDISLGSTISSVAGGVIITDTLNNDMHDITSLEADAGVIIYRGFYYRNNHATLTWADPVFWIESQTNSGFTEIAIAIADEAVNVTMAGPLANENTAPGGSVVFSIVPVNKASGLVLGSLPPAGGFKGTWLRYTVTAGAGTVLDQYTIRAEGDTPP